jgi:RNA polymerase sigma-70 factor (ECF subfamily)
MEGIFMSAVLEAPIMTAEGQPEEEILPGSQNSKKDLRVVPTTFNDFGGLFNVDFEGLYHTYQRRVYRQCFRMLGNQEDAEDLTQEVFLQLYRKADTFRGEASFSTWLYRLTINTVLMQLRRHRRWGKPLASLDVPPGADKSVSDLIEAASAQQTPAASAVDRLGLDLAIAQLPPGYKEIFLLHDAEGYRHEEIAKILGISEGTSKSQLHKARLRLRTLLGPRDDGSACFHRKPPAHFVRKKREHSRCAVQYAMA